MFFSSHGLLGQNARNLQYIKGGNFLLSKKLADSKLKTKKFLASHKVAVPETLGIIRKHSEIDIKKIISYAPPFVVKPNNGYGGKGILIIDAINAEGNFITNSGDIYSPQQLAIHFTYILDGFFSLSWGRDRVIIEKKIILTKEIELLGKFGLPDIRVISYNMVPVMAMMRIPTAESGGKANIHGWACAVGIDIGTGKLSYISKGGKQVKSIPDIGDVRGITIPEWDKILSLAVQVQQVTGIKFLGCDIVLDEQSWPLLLEINIRPGLAIQNANLAPLKTRLDKVEGVDVGSVEKWVRLGRDLFSWDIEERIKHLSGKKIVGSREYLKIFHNEKVYNYIAEIRVSKEESFIDKNFVQDILKIDLWDKSKLRLECDILGITRTIRFEICDGKGENIVIWKNSLRGFLIDPFKYKKWENPTIAETDILKGANTAITKTHHSQLQALDAMMMKIDKKLLVLKYVKPTNLLEQKQIFIEKKGDYIPVFQYPTIDIDFESLEKDIKNIEIPDIPWADIYIKKLEEIHNKISLLQALQSQNIGDITLYSKKLFWDVLPENFQRAKDIVSQRWQAHSEEDFLSYEDIKDYMKKFNHIYNIKVKMSEAETTARFTMKWDSLIFRKWAKVGKREMRSIIAHEIEGHYLRKINGRKSKLSILARGTAGYIETDEGLAIYNQNRFLSPQDKKYYSIFERYYFIGYALKHSYKRLIKHLVEFYDEDYEKVFSFMLRLKRGFQDPSKSGVFMKDTVYVNGFFSVEDFLNSWGSIHDLYIWKLHIDDLELIKKNPFFTQHKKDIVIPFSV